MAPKSWASSTDCASRRSWSLTLSQKNPTPHQRSLLELLAARADQVVVMSEAASRRLRRGFDIAGRKVTTIPYGATVPTKASCMRSGRPILLTQGLLGPGRASSG